MIAAGILLATLWTATHSAVSISIFQKCSEGKISDSVSISKPVVSVRSQLECASLCGKSSSCLAMNVCRNMLSSTAVCELLDVRSLEGCTGLSHEPVKQQTCVYIEKTFPRKISCLNNGTSNGTHCRCLIQYSGKFCERLIRDCTEPFEHGFIGAKYNGVYTIQPLGTDDPFLAFCTFEGNGNTYAFYRKEASPFQTFNVNFTTAKAGFGDDLTTAKELNYFFMGLEKMHCILRQGDYKNSVFLLDSNWANIGCVDYLSFSVGPEASKYPITYQTVINAPADNGFGDSQPVLFSADGFQGAETCALNKRSPGWYGANCEGFSPFATPLLWPVNQNNVTVKLLNMNLIRQSPFSDA